MATITAQKSSTIYVPVFDAPYTLPRAVAQPVWNSSGAAILLDGFGGNGALEAQAFGSSATWGPQAVCRINYTWLTVANAFNTYLNNGTVDYSNAGMRCLQFQFYQMQGVANLINTPLSNNEQNPLCIFTLPPDQLENRTLSGLYPMQTIGKYQDINTLQSYNGTWPLARNGVVMNLNKKVYIGSPNVSAFPNQIILYGYNPFNYTDIVRVKLTDYSAGFSDSFIVSYSNASQNVVMYNTTAGSQYVRLINFNYYGPSRVYEVYSDNLIQFDDSNYGGTSNNIGSCPTGFLWNPELSTQTKLCILDPSGEFYSPVVLQPQTANAFAVLGSDNATYAPSPGLTIDGDGIAYIVGNTTSAGGYVGSSFAANVNLGLNLFSNQIQPIPLPCFSPCASIGNTPIK
jgi:hypothetical protein